jgi:hypothetical protein
LHTTTESKNQVEGRFLLNVYAVSTASTGGGEEQTADRANSL